MVPIIITGRNGVSTKQKDHAKDKISKLERYFNGITRMEVVLDKGPDRSRAEVLISIKKGSPIVCHHDDTDLYKAIDLIIDKAEVQLTRHKEKIQHKRNRVEIIMNPAEGFDSNSDDDLEDDQED